MICVLRTSHCRYTYVHVLQGQEVFLPGRGGGLVCVFPLLLYLGSDVCLVAHVWSDGAYKHSLYLVLYKLSVNPVDWKFEELSLFAYFKFCVHFFFSFVHVCALRLGLGYSLSILVHVLA